MSFWRVIIFYYIASRFTTRFKTFIQNSRFEFPRFHRLIVAENQSKTKRKDSRLRDYNAYRRVFSIGVHVQLVRSTILITIIIISIFRNVETTSGVRDNNNNNNYYCNNCVFYCTREILAATHPRLITLSAGGGDGVGGSGAVVPPGAAVRTQFTDPTDRPTTATATLRRLRRRRRRRPVEEGQHRTPAPHVEPVESPQLWSGPVRGSERCDDGSSMGIKAADDSRWTAVAVCPRARVHTSTVSPRRAFATDVVPGSAGPLPFARTRRPDSNGRAPEGSFDAVEYARPKLKSRGTPASCGRPSPLSKGR